MCTPYFLMPLIRLLYFYFTNILQNFLINIDPDNDINIYIYTDTDTDIDRKVRLLLQISHFSPIYLFSLLLPLIIPILSRTFRLFAWLVTSPQALKFKEEVGHADMLIHKINKHNQ